MNCKRCTKLGFDKCLCLTDNDKIAKQYGATHKDYNSNLYYKKGYMQVKAGFLKDGAIEWYYYGTYEPMSAVVL